MGKRTIVAVFIAFILTIGFTALWSAEGDERDGDTATNIVAANGAEAGQTDVPKKKGNRFARFFKAPIKAIGKLFDGGDSEGQARRLTEKDARRFESVGVVRVEDRRSTDDAPRGADTETMTARELLDEGRALLEAGRLNEAIAALSRATSLDPRLSQAHSLLAVAYDRKGLHDRARESYDRAIDFNEKDAQALNNLGYSLYLSGNYRAAVDRLKRAAKLAPTDSRILNNLALAQCRLGKFDDAYRNFARAAGEFDAHINVATLLERTGREGEAIRHYEQARRLQPDSLDVTRRLAELYRRTNRDDITPGSHYAIEAANAAADAAAVASSRR